MTLQGIQKLAVVIDILPKDALKKIRQAWISKLFTDDSDQIFVRDGKWCKEDRWEYFIRELTLEEQKINDAFTTLLSTVKDFQ